MAFMRHNNNGRRHNNNRHRHQGNGNNQQQGQRRHVNRINHVFESNGPEGRVRGTAQQIVEKYMTMARDAQSAGDKVLSMNYYQHAEHYQRLLNEIQEENVIFERDREVARAAQQAAQPEISAEDAETGFADNAARNAEQNNAVQNDGADAGQQSRPQRNAQPPRGAQQRMPRRKNDEDDLNTLPGFLQVPITESAPPASVADGNEPSENAKPRAVRAVRTRRVASTVAAETPDSAE